MVQSKWRDCYCPVGILDLIKCRIGIHGNTGEPPVSTRVRNGHPNGMVQELMVFNVTVSYVKEEDIDVVVSEPRETEGKEMDEGSLSYLIVLQKAGKSVP